MRLGDVRVKTGDNIKCAKSMSSWKVQRLTCFMTVFIMGDVSLLKMSTLCKLTNTTEFISTKGSWRRRSN